MFENNDKEAMLVNETNPEGNELFSTSFSLLRSRYWSRHAPILPTNGCSFELCIPFLKLTNKEQVSIFWKPGLWRKCNEKYDWQAANKYMHVIGSQ